ncbi:TPA: hypothetical protein ACN31Q_000459 [Vibrio campbellii]
MERIGLIILCVLAIYLITEKIIKDFSDWEKEFAKECILKKERHFLKKEYLKDPSGHIDRRIRTKELLKNNIKGKTIKEIDYE